jgi:hypothetical protein
MLGDVPSEAVDREIVRVCCQRPRPTGILSFVGVFTAKPVLAVLFLILGVGVGVYFAYNAQLLAPKGPATAQTPKMLPAEPSAAQAPEEAPLAVSEETGDSLAADSASEGSTRPFSERRGGLSGQGVVPVKVHK